MPSTYSPNLRLELIGSGEQASVWGNTTNVNLGTLIEGSICGQSTITMPDGDYTLTALNGAQDEARNAILYLSGTLTATRNVICPAVSKIYLIRNNTNQSLIIKTASSTNVSTIPSGQIRIVYCDGVDFRDAGGTAGAVTSVSASAPLQSSGGASPTISLVTNPTFSGSVSFPGTVTFNSGTNTYTLPNNRGTPGYVLGTDGTGGTSWIVQSGSGGGGVTSVAVGASGNLSVSPASGVGNIVLDIRNNPVFSGAVSVNSLASTGAVSGSSGTFSTLTAGGTTYPLSAGSAGQILTSNGSTAVWATGAFANANGSNATGINWNISILGNAATATSATTASNALKVNNISYPSSVPAINGIPMVSFGGNSAFFPANSTSNGYVLPGGTCSTGAALSGTWSINISGVATYANGAYANGVGFSVPPISSGRALLLLGETTTTTQWATGGAIGIKNSTGALVLRGPSGSTYGVGIESNDGANIPFYTSYNGLECHCADAASQSLFSLSIANHSIGTSGTLAVRVNSTTGLVGYDSSSRLLKKDIEPLSIGLVDNAISNLQAVWYRRIDEVDPSLSEIGLIAEDVFAVEPRLAACKRLEDGSLEPVGVEYARLSVILLAKVQELEQRIKELEAK